MTFRQRAYFVLALPLLATAPLGLHAGRGLPAATPGPMGEASLAASPLAAPWHLIPEGQAGGPMTTVEVQGSAAWVGFGPRVAHFERDSESWAPMGTSPDLGDLVVEVAPGAIAVAARLGDNTLVLLDPTTLAEEVRLVPEGPGPIHGMTMDGSGKYLVLSIGGELRSYAVSATALVHQSTVLDIRGDPAARDETLFVGGADGGLVAVSVIDPGALSEVGRLDTPSVDAVVAPAGDDVFALARAGASAVILAVDAADPTHLAERWRTTAESGLAFDVGGGAMWESWLGSGAVRALSTAGPEPLGELQTFVPTDVAGVAEGALVAAMDGLRVVGLDAGGPVERAHLSQGAGAGTAVAASAQVAYVAHGSGMVTFRVPGLQFLGSVTRPGEQGGAAADAKAGPRDLALGDSGLAFAAAGETGLVALDIGDPGQPRVAGRLSAETLGDVARCVGEAGGRVLVGGDQGITLVSVAAEGAMTRDGWIPTDAPVEGVAPVPGQPYALVALGAAGLVVQNLESASAGARLDGISSAAAVAVDHALGLVLDGTDLVTLDLSDPARPMILGRGRVTETPGLAVAVEGELAAVAAPNGEVAAISLRRPSAPAVIGSRRVRTGGARDVAVSGGRILAVGGFDGLRVFRPDPSAPAPFRMFLPRLTTGGIEADLAGARGANGSPVEHRGPCREPARGPVRPLTLCSETSPSLFIQPVNTISGSESNEVNEA